MEKERIDVDNIRLTNVKDLKGLARLVKVAFEMEVPPNDRWDVRPLLPEGLGSLRGEAQQQYNDIEKFIKAIGGGYDEEAPDRIVISEVFGSDVRAMHMDWFHETGGDTDSFPLASLVRDAAWQEIEEAEDFDYSDSVAVKLTECWDTKKRSREYLNANTEKYYLDGLYYGHAYRS